MPVDSPPVDSPELACLYFIIDSAASLVLYVGETCRSNKRWKGIHASKDYIASYQDLHYRYGMKTAVNAAFWWDAPVERRARQELELNLILKWRSLSRFPRLNGEIKSDRLIMLVFP